MRFFKKNSADNTDGSYNIKKNKNINILSFIVCVFLAFCVWVYVMNVKMSDNTKTFSIVPDVKGEGALLNDTGLSLFGTIDDTVKITIKGTKAEIQKYSEKDFKVYVDVSSVEEAGITPLSVVVESPSAAITVVSVEPSIFTVMIDKSVTKEIPLVVLSGKTEIGLLLEPSVQSISVTGPASYVEKIAVARGSIDAGAADAGKVIDLNEVILLDANEAPVLASYLEYSLEDLTVTVYYEAVDPAME